MKTLIAYTTKHGSTEKCGKVINERLRTKGNLIDIKKDKAKIKEYDVILLGFSVYAGKAQKEMINFINSNEKILKNKEIGLFICCNDGEKSMEFMKENLPNWIYEKAFVKKHLGHEIHFDKMNFFERFIYKVVAKSKESYSDIKDENIKALSNEVNKLVGLNE
ncbi:MAG: flavodoxin [Firmicutes bacterium]|nr:flavodoxin [Bacillota bacterium]